MDLTLPGGSGGNHKRHANAHASMCVLVPLASMFYSTGSTRGEDPRQALIHYPR